jgi:hypothetical protein
MSVNYLTVDELASFARVMQEVGPTDLWRNAQMLEEVSRSNCAAIRSTYNELRDRVTAEAIAAVASRISDPVDLHFGPLAYNCIANNGATTLIDDDLQELQQLEEKCRAWMDGKQRQRTRAAEDAEAFAHVGPLPLISETDLAAACHANGCKRVIIAEFCVDASCPYTDYRGGRTVRRVVIGFGKGERENFRQLRKAAALFPPTAHLGPGMSRFRVRVYRDERQDNSYTPTTLEGPTFSTADAAEAWIQQEIAADTQIGLCIGHYGYELEEDDIENRETYSMGGGNYLGWARHDDWRVYSQRTHWGVPDGLEFYDADAQPAETPEPPAQPLPRDQKPRYRWTPDGLIPAAQ